MTVESRPFLYLVDDEPDQLFLLRRAAERGGEFGEIRTAMDSQLAYQDCLDRAERGDSLPGLLITDWKMPGWTGAELACALNQHPRLKEIPIVALSSSSLPLDQAHALACGCRAFLQKPPSFYQLVDLFKVLAYEYGKAPAEARA